MPSWTASRRSLVAKGFGQKLDRAALHRLDRHRYIAVSGHENDGKFYVARGELTLQVETALAGKSNVEN